MYHTLYSYNEISQRKNAIKKVVRKKNINSAVFIDTVSLCDMFIR